MKDFETKIARKKIIIAGSYEEFRQYCFDNNHIQYQPTQLPREVSGRVERSALLPPVVFAQGEQGCSPFGR